tara:strand:- start:334 stop:687 length:354 start_codon:yes stop_codon:yes gene_type:complete
MTTFAVLTTPATPLFAEVYNPYLKLTELTGCPQTGESMSMEHWFFEYFNDVNVSDREEILASFDKLGYFESVEDGYLVTIFPQTDNQMIEDSDAAAQESIHDFCSLVAANFRKDSIV